MSHLNEIHISSFPQFFTFRFIYSADIAASTFLTHPVGKAGYPGFSDLAVDI
jgi:hypothetical protein